MSVWDLYVMSFLQMVFLPEACDYIADSKEQSLQMLEPLDGNLVSRYRQVAKDNQMWLSVGGFHQKVRNILTYAIL
jgi:hypothetical protein